MDNKFEFREVISQFTQQVAALRDMYQDPFYPVVAKTEEQFLELQDGARLLNFASCDYLGFSKEEQLQEIAIDAIRQQGLNITGAQIFSGFSEIHAELERKIAKLYRKEAACLFASGMLANIGVLTALAGPDDYIFNDLYNHSSLMAGSRLSGASNHVFPHNNMDRLVREIAKAPVGVEKVIAADGVFSADGDAAPVAELADIAEQHGAHLVVDEAHSLGVIGSNLSGAADYSGALDRVTVITGTMSKAIGSVGGFATGPAELMDFLKLQSPFANSSRGTPYGLAAASSAALDMLPEKGAERSAKVVNVANMFADQCRDAGFDVLHGHSAIVSIVCGEAEKTLDMAMRLRAAGILASPMLYPSVPKRLTRLRFCLTVFHEEEDVENAAKVLKKEAENVVL